MQRYGGLKVNIVSVHVLYIGFTPVYIRQDVFFSVGRDVELDNMRVKNIGCHEYY